MKNLKRILSTVLAVTMLLALNTAAFAADSTGYSDVAANAWYAGAVAYVTDNGLMNGTGTAQFSPNEPTNLAMLLTILHRDAGSPAATAAAPAGASGWYADAAAWANEQGLLAGINNTFTGAPVTREDMVTVLWRYAGSPAGNGEDFADEGEIASYAAQAVDWSRANSVVNGNPGNLFEPKGSATRAQLATILQNYFTKNQQAAPAPEPETPSTTNGKTLVVYYSATGSTKAVAEHIAGTLNADTFELTPVNPYSSDDLNWTDSGSRVNAEHNDASLRNIALTSTTVDNWESYDTVFIGYPIWWGIAAWPTDAFVKANDFTGKTVIPFCTSASSGLGQSGTLLAEMAGTGSWLEGRRFTSRASQSEVQEWVNSLNIK